MAFVTPVVEHWLEREMKPTMSMCYHGCRITRHVPISTPMWCHGSLCSTTSPPASQPTKTDSDPAKRMAMYPKWPLRLIRGLIFVMRWRDFACIESRGGHTSYWSDFSLNFSDSLCVLRVVHEYDFFIFVPHITLSSLYGCHFQCLYCWHFDLFNTFYFMHI